MFERISAMLLFASQKSSATAAYKDCDIAWFLCSWKIYHLFSTKKNSFVKKKIKEKSIRQFFCRREYGKNQITSAITSAIGDCRRELKSPTISYLNKMKLQELAKLLNDFINVQTNYFLYLCWYLD